MDNNKIREFIKSLSMSDKNITASQAEQYLTDALNELNDTELQSYLKACEKVATMTEADNNVKKTVKELFTEIFPSLSFYPALGIWGLVDKMIQSGTISGLDTADRDKLIVYSAIFFGLVGGKIAYNRIKEKVNEIKSVDSQISETLKRAGVQLDEKREQWDAMYGDEYLGSSEIERDEKTGEGKLVKEFKKTPVERAVEYVYDGMKAKYGRKYPEDEDESDYSKELSTTASKKFNVSYDEIIDKIASDYVDTMPYVIQDKQGNYSEIPDDVHQMLSSIYD